MDLFWPFAGLEVQLKHPSQPLDSTILSFPMGKNKITEVKLISTVVMLVRRLTAPAYMEVSPQRILPPLEFIQGYH